MKPFVDQIGVSEHKHNIIHNPIEVARRPKYITNNYFYN